jgi:hypothetical protein
MLRMQTFVHFHDSTMIKKCITVLAKSLGTELLLLE